MVGDRKLLEIPKESFFGLDVSIFELKELDLYIENILDSHRTEIFYGHSLWSPPMIKKFPEIYKYGNSADILVTDGRPFFLLCKLYGLNVKSDISIPQLVLRILNICNKKNKKVFLLGATEEINSIAVNNLKTNYPNLKDCKGHNGYYSESEFDDIIRRINEYKADLILIGISSPLKEKLAVLLKKKTHSKIIIPCGGMIDVLAGKTNITPRLIKKVGLASFYRLIQEPRRLCRRQIMIYSFWLSFLPKLIWLFFTKENYHFPHTLN